MLAVRSRGVLRCSPAPEELSARSGWRLGRERASIGSMGVQPLHSAADERTVMHHGSRFGFEHRDFGVVSHRGSFCTGLAAAACLAFAAAASAQSLPHSGCADRHSTADAWWAGPLLANSAATLPRGHALIESYIYDNTVQGAFNAQGKRLPATHMNSFGSLSYMEYAVTDKTELGLLPAAGYNRIGGDVSASGGGLGDWTLQLQRRVVAFDPCTSLPTVSVAVQQSLPTGKYDQLARPGDGLGSGAFTTNLALFTQTWFWLPNHRIVRMRVDAFESMSSTLNLRDMSVYGTADGFHGTAHPGNSSCVDLAWEYSLTRRWVLATDLVYHAAGNTGVAGTMPSGTARIPITMSSGSSSSWGYAPAVEYSWKPWLGAVVGTRVIAGGRNTSETVMPAFGINFVH